MLVARVTQRQNDPSLMHQFAGISRRLRHQTFFPRRKNPFCHQSFASLSHRHCVFDFQTPDKYDLRMRAHDSIDASGQFCCGLCNFSASYFAWSVLRSVRQSFGRTKMSMKSRHNVRCGLSRLVVACCVTTLFGTVGFGAGPEDRVIVKVNGAEIHENDLVFAEEDIGADVKQLDPQRKREEYIKYLQDVKLLSGFAVKEKLAESAEVRREIDRQASFARSKAIMTEKLDEIGKATLRDEAFLRSIYQDLRNSVSNEREVRVRDIEFKFTNRDDSEQVKAAQAKAIKAMERAKNGEDFEALSRELSENPDAKQNGGDLGYRSKAQLMFLGLSGPAFKLEKGAVSEPFITTFSWHVIKVEDIRPRQMPDFETIRKQVEQMAVYKAQSSFVAKLRQNAKIERFDQPPAAAPQEQKNSKK